MLLSAVALYLLFAPPLATLVVAAGLVRLCRPPSMRRGVAEFGNPPGEQRACGEAPEAGGVET